MAGTMKKGNWFEEAALQTYTGISAKEFDPQDKKSGKYTYTRCIEHSDRMDPKDFESVMASCIKDPQSHPSAQTLKDRTGPRSALLEARMKAQVEATVKETNSLAYTRNRKVEYMSEMGRNFNRDSFQQSLHEGSDPNRVKTHSANYCTDAPITVYSAAADAGTVTFPMTFSVSSNPFRKSAAFSVKIQDTPSANKTESNERSRPFPTVIEYAGVRSFKERLIRHTAAKFRLMPGTGKVMAAIVERLWGLITVAVPQVHVDALVTGMETELGFIITDEEKRGLLRTFNSDTSGMLNLPELTDYLRGSLSPRSGELVDIILARLEDRGQGINNSLTEADIAALYKGSDDIAISKAGQMVTLDDLYEFFTDCASELETAERFEVMLAQWM